MNYQLYNSSGTIEAVIDDNCGMKKFYCIADALISELKIQFLEKLDEFDSIEWNFKYKGHSLKMHFNIYNGVSITPAYTKANDAVIELASLLKRKLF